MDWPAGPLPGSCALAPRGSRPDPSRLVVGRPEPPRPQPPPRLPGGRRRRARGRLSGVPVVALRGVCCRKLSTVGAGPPTSWARVPPMPQRGPGLWGERTVRPCPPGTCGRRRCLLVPVPPPPLPCLGVTVSAPRGAPAGDGAGPGDAESRTRRRWVRRDVGGLGRTRPAGPEPRRERVCAPGSAPHTRRPWRCGAAPAASPGVGAETRGHGASSRRGPSPPGRGRGLRAPYLPPGPRGGRPEPGELTPHPGGRPEQPLLCAPAAADAL